MATTEDDIIIEKHNSPRHKPSTSYPLNNGYCESFTSSAKRTTITCNSLSKSLSQETLQEFDNNYNTVLCPMKGFKEPKVFRTGKRKGSLDLSELQADSALASLTTLTMGLAQIHKVSEHERQDDVGHNLGN
uniref:Uncharacterized protein n=1 Tax=Romanomermis culicivorax TaxID=13658 RepID=A0A915I6E9_ROMCU